jgi:hypothetical protein
MKPVRTALAAALLLAVFCCLFPISAGASYPDAAGVEHMEAVDSLTCLGLFSGFEDGSFRPDAILTRAQMCKLICLAFTGGNDPVLNSESGPVFRDTGGHWAEDYITYCYHLGVVSGDAGPGGSFRPDDTVTAAEAAKMVLVTLGYDAGLSGFTGGRWALGVAVAASGKSLFSNLEDISLSTGLSRDDTAQLLYNALETSMVTYTYSLATVDGKLISLPRAVDTTDTILSKNFGAVKLEGVITANETASAVGGAASLLPSGLTGLDTDGDRDIDLTFQTVTGPEDLGKRVSVYAKDYEDGVYRTVYGSPVSSGSNAAATIVRLFLRLRAGGRAERSRY